MTTKEIDRIENAIRHIQTSTDIDPWAAEIAVEAMRKQIPQRPVIGYAFPGKLREVMKRTDPEKAETKTDCCPVCGRTLGVSKFVQAQSGLRFGDPHCKRCGQAIDWDEVRDDEHIAYVSKKVERASETAQNASDSDLVSRKAAIDALEKCYTCKHVYQRVSDADTLYCRCRKGCRYEEFKPKRSTGNPQWYEGRN